MCLVKLKGLGYGRAADTLELVSKCPKEISTIAEMSGQFGPKTFGL